MLTATADAFQNEMRAKQHAVDALYSSRRTPSIQLSDARRALETLQEKAKVQQLARHRVLNLSRAHEDEQRRLDIQQRSRATAADPAAAGTWEAEAEAVMATASVASDVLMTMPSSPSLPSADVLAARIRIVRHRADETRRAEANLRSRSGEAARKFRHLVALSVRCADAEVDDNLEGLVRAVESEKAELDIGRVRRFLGGVEAIVH